MAKAINQHWVPTFYLRYFATPETKDKKKPKAYISIGKGRSKKEYLKKIATDRYLYSPEDVCGE